MIGCASSSSSGGGGSGGGGTTPARVLASTPMQMAGDRCHGDTCICRTVDDYNRSSVTDETAVPEGQKRFELRTGRGLDGMSIIVEGKGAMHKDAGVSDPACGYLDLPPGKHRVRLHMKASAEDAGMVPSFWINEWGARTHDWYESFRFKCGGNEPCTKDHMAQWNDTDGKKPRGIFDPCGSSRIESIRWEVEHSPDVRVNELSLEFVIDVYKFVPRFPHGAKTCKGVGGVEVEDAPKDLPQ
jgi:hypothetical protein